MLFTTAFAVVPVDTNTRERHDETGEKRNAEMQTTGHIKTKIHFGSVYKQVRDQGNTCKKHETDKQHEFSVFAPAVFTEVRECCHTNLSP